MYKIRWREFVTGGRVGGINSFSRTWLSMEVPIEDLPNGCMWVARQLPCDSIIVVSNPDGLEITIFINYDQE